MTESIESKLTPEQSADVILYFHDNANKKTRGNGWNDKLALGEAALRSIRRGRHSLLPDRSAMLTPKEMNTGLDHIEALSESDE
jgi:hypothetical protein